MKIKLNCDLGESFGSWRMGNDAEIMPLIDMANIACGFHASDPMIMKQTIILAKQHQVSISAHPGYPDLQGFGRRSMNFNHDEIVTMIQYQVGALQALCVAQGKTVDYVKPHGALYHAMMNDTAVREAVFTSVSELSGQFGRALPLVVLANNQADEMTEEAGRFSVDLLFEAFADRMYTDEGALVPRNQANAVLHEIDEILDHIEHLVSKQQVTTISGKLISIQADTVCVHGDHPQALRSVKAIRQSIEASTS